MGRDIWTQDVMRFDVPEEEPETVGRVVRGSALAAEEAARERDARRRAEEQRRSPLMRVTISPGEGGEPQVRVEKQVRGASGAQEWVPAPTGKNDQAFGKYQPGPGRNAG